MPATEVLPLPVLLSRVLGHLTAGLEATAGVGPTVPSLAVWANVVRAVVDAGPDGTDERALAPTARVSTRLAVAAVSGAVRRGWISGAPVPGGGKHRQARATDLGKAAALVWPETLASLDADRSLGPLRDSVEVIVGRLPIELSHFPSSYGTADPSAVGGPYMQRAGMAEGAVAHGRDWKPVPRGPGDTTSSLPLTALLSQVLMAFTIDYENRFPWPLASTLTVLCHLTSEPRPLADVPGDHGITGNGKSLLERHQIATVTREPADPKRKLVALTDRGVAVLHHHPSRLEAVEAEWRTRLGDDTIDALRSRLGPLAAGAADRPDYVIAPLHLG